MYGFSAAFVARRKGKNVMIDSLDLSEALGRGYWVVFRNYVVSNEFVEDIGPLWMARSYYLFVKERIRDSSTSTRTLVMKSKDGEIEVVLSFEGSPDGYAIDYKYSGQSLSMNFSEAFYLCRVIERVYHLKRHMETKRYVPLSGVRRAVFFRLDRECWLVANHHENSLFKVSNGLFSSDTSTVLVEVTGSRNGELSFFAYSEGKHYEICSGTCREGRVVNLRLDREAMNGWNSGLLLDFFISNSKLW